MRIIGHIVTDNPHRALCGKHLDGIPRPDAKVVCGECVRRSITAHDRAMNDYDALKREYDILHRRNADVIRNRAAVVDQNAILVRGLDAISQMVEDVLKESYDITATKKEH